MTEAAPTIAEENCQAKMAEDRLLTTEMVRVRLGYQTRQGVYDLIDGGKLQAEYFPREVEEGRRRQIRVRESALNAYIANYVIPDAVPLLNDQGGT